MASFQAPPGHLSQAEVLIVCGLVESQLSIQAPDPSLPGPCLTTAEGGKLTTTADIVRHLSQSGNKNAASLYPSAGPAQVRSCARAQSGGGGGRSQPHPCHTTHHQQHNNNQKQPK